MTRSASRREAAVSRHEQIRAKAASLEQKSGLHPRFVADVMLGRLAKWLRIAGFDVLYSNRFTDDELITISNLDNRILLSRDTRLLIRKPVKEFVFVNSENIQKQIRLVFETVGISSLDSLLTRCLVCNEALVETPRESVREQVPEFVYKTQSRFKFCPGCHKIFWAGTHRNTVVQTLQNLLPLRRRLT